MYILIFQVDYLAFLFSGYLNLGYSTPFLSLGSSYMYPSLPAAKAAVISVGEEIATLGLPRGICPLVFVFTGSGNGIMSLLCFNLSLHFKLIESCDRVFFMTLLGSILSPPLVWGNTRKSLLNLLNYASTPLLNFICPNWPSSVNELKERHDKDGVPMLSLL